MVPGAGSVAGMSTTAARDLVKVYGSGPTAVRALDQVSVSFPAATFSARPGPMDDGVLAPATLSPTTASPTGSSGVAAATSSARAA